MYNGAKYVGEVFDMKIFDEFKSKFGDVKKENVKRHDEKMVSSWFYLTLGMFVGFFMWFHLRLTQLNVQCSTLYTLHCLWNMDY